MFSTYPFYKKSATDYNFESFTYKEDEKKWQYSLQFH